MIGVTKKKKVTQNQFTMFRKKHEELVEAHHCQWMPQN